VVIGVATLDANGWLPLTREGSAEQNSLSRGISGGVNRLQRRRINFSMPDTGSLAWQQPSFFLTQRQDHYTILA